MHVIPALWRLRWEYPKLEAKLAPEEEPLPKQNKPHVVDSSERLSTSRGIGGRQLKQILSDGTETGPLFVVNVCCKVLLCYLIVHITLREKNEGDLKESGKIIADFPQPFLLLYSPVEKMICLRTCSCC